MQTIRFAIRSISRYEYEALAWAYHTTFLREDEERARSWRSRFLGWFRKVFVRIKRKPEPASTRMEFFPTYCEWHPVLDPRFLAFCIEIAELLALGYTIGRGNGTTLFFPDEAISLSPHVPDSTIIYVAGTKIRAGDPEQFEVEVPDMPTLQLLRRFASFTGDRDISATVNHLAYWLNMFAYAHYSSRLVVAKREAIGGIVICVSEFFNDWPQLLTY